MPETASQQNLLAYFPEDVQGEPDIRTFVGQLASYALVHLITPGEANQLAMHAGALLRYSDVPEVTGQ